MSSTPADDPHIAAAIARAEARRAVLERVTVVTMALLEEAARLETGVESKPQAHRAAVKDVAQLSRAVRLTLAQETRLDELILALRKGDIPKPAGAGRRASAKPELWSPVQGFKSNCPVRDPVQLAVWTAIEQSPGDEDEDLHKFDRLYERLFESREYDRFDFSDFTGAVRGICADLGVDPDWTLWDGDKGFRRPQGDDRPRARAKWRWPSDDPEPRRLRLLSDPDRPETILALARAGPFKLE